jgi:hypothetical protein
MQTIVAVFRDEPRIYNPASYLLWAPFLLVWAVATLRSRFSLDHAWLALAAMAPLSMLPTLHRPNDTKILLLVLPACALLWARGGIVRWLAVCLTSACMVLTAGIPIAALLRLTRNLHLSTATLSGKILTVLVARPAPLILLATGTFFLWIYARQTSSRSGQSESLAAAVN